MGARDVVVNVLLSLAVFGEAVCVLGLLAGRTAIDRLHYAGAATTVPPFLIAAAIVVKEAGTQPSVNAIVVAVLVIVLGAALGHATARLIARELGKL